MTQPFEHLKTHRTERFDRFRDGDIPIESYLLQMAHVVTLTGNVPIAVYRKAYITREQVAHPNFKLGKDSNGHFKEHCNCRLQDGLVVVDNDEGLPDSVHLLVDDNRSLLKSIYRLKLAVLREYDIFAHED